MEWPEVKEIDRWLKASGMAESRLGLLAAANANAISRIRSGSATVNTLRAVLAYIRANPASTRKTKPKT